MDQKKVHKTPAGFLKSVKVYVDICKPRLVLLLYFSGFTSLLIASSIYGYKWKVIILMSLAIILSVMGANSTTAYIDRKIDGIMFRTKDRPVPSGIISPPWKALLFGLVLLVTGIVIAVFVNYLSALFILIGFLDSALIYNAWTKRKSYLNIIFAAPAGGMPVLAGWAAVSGGRIDLVAILLFIFVMIWTPVHIWSLAFFYRDDYKRANVPMLPTAMSDKNVYVLLASLNLAIIFFSIFIGIYFDLSPAYLIVAILAGLAVIIFSILLLIKRSKKVVWILFKFSSPYLGVVLMMLIIEYVFLR
jgi:protoheme IX farnesyltransferase